MKEQIILTVFVNCFLISLNSMYLGKNLNNFKESKKVKIFTIIQIIIILFGFFVLYDGLNKVII